MDDTDLVSWLPDLTGSPIEDLLGLDLDAATALMLARVDRPLATVAGSNGS